MDHRGGDSSTAVVVGEGNGDDVPADNDDDDVGGGRIGVPNDNGNVLRPAAVAAAAPVTTIAIDHPRGKCRR